METTSTQVINLLLVDDHVMFRQGLARVLEKESGFKVVGQFGSSAEALAVLMRALTLGSAVGVYQAFLDGDAIAAPRRRLHRRIGVNHRAVGAHQHDAVGKPVERTLERVARLAGALKPPRHVERLLQMRQQSLHRGDASGVDMALSRRRVDADAGKFLRVGD